MRGYFADMPEYARPFLEAVESIRSRTEGNPAEAIRQLNRLMAEMGEIRRDDPRVALDLLAVDGVLTEMLGKAAASDESGLSAIERTLVAIEGEDVG